MLPSLTVAFIAGLLVGSQIPYFPLSASFLLLLAALGAFILRTIELVHRSPSDLALRSTPGGSHLLGGGRHPGCQHGDG